MLSWEFAAAGSEVGFWNGGPFGLEDGLFFEAPDASSVAFDAEDAEECSGTW